MVQIVNMAYLTYRYKFLPLRLNIVHMANRTYRHRYIHLRYNLDCTCTNSYQRRCGRWLGGCNLRYVLHTR